MRDVTIAGNQARLAPLRLTLSETTRLRRLAREAIYKEDARQLVVPIRAASTRPPFLVAFLRELVPPPAVEAIA